jgi:hypothetical protein
LSEESIVGTPSVCLLRAPGRRIERDVLSAEPATHFRHRPKFNLNAAGFVPMRSVALTLRRVAQMASFENGMKVGLKIMPPQGTGIGS